MLYSRCCFVVCSQCATWGGCDAIRLQDGSVSSRRGYHARPDYRTGDCGGNVMAKIAVITVHGETIIGTSITLDGMGNVSIWIEGVIIKRVYPFTVERIVPVE